MKERPIIFSTSMVRAILANAKLQTRRVMEVQPPSSKHQLTSVIESKTKSDIGKFTWCLFDEPELNKSNRYFNCPYGAPGDRLWVRETWAESNNRKYIYFADPLNEIIIHKWKPSIHMPRKAARLFLEIENITAEKLQDINDTDCFEEGILAWTKTGNIQKFSHLEPGEPGALPWDLMAKSPKEAFKNLWDSINKTTHPWESNPWVWKITFSRLLGVKSNG